jgi:hypothetical protein
MWERYGAQGTGFVVGLDAQNAFFENAGNNTLRKVIYTDEFAENFWRNPYYLFLVKNNKWSYEQEWLTFGDFTKCDEHFIAEGAVPIHLANLPPSIIKTIHFGWAYDASTVDFDILNLSRVGATPTCYRIAKDKTLNVEPILRSLGSEPPLADSKAA